MTLLVRCRKNRGPGKIREETDSAKAKYLTGTEIHKTPCEFTVSGARGTPHRSRGSGTPLGKGHDGHLDTAKKTTSMCSAELKWTKIGDQLTWAYTRHRSY